MSTEHPWMDSAKTPRERAEALVAAMTLEQKIAQLHGTMETVDIYDLANSVSSAEEMEQLTEQIQVERHVDAAEELEIPRMRVTNGPVGVGMGDGYPSPKATARPMTIGLAAGFDPQLARDYGDLIGSETATLGQHVLEGPGVCLHRTAISGRNFEYFSEDPFLSGVIGVEVTKGIQDHDVIPMGKHFAVNDQETERFRPSVEIDEHVLRELYLLPFEMLVKDGRIAAIMSAYNRVRGTYATESRYLLHDILRRFTQMFRFDQFGKEYDPGQIDAAAHGAASRRIGAQLAVLLKNDDARLPLDPQAARGVVIIGQSEYVDEACNGGGGSSKVDPLYTVTPLDGMRDVLADLASEASVDKVTVARDLSNLHEAVPEADPSAVVVLKDSTPVLMPWIGKASAVLEAWNQGAEYGHVVADLLYGNVKPSGTVPTAYMRREQDSTHHDRAERHPGVDEGDVYPTIRYSEGLEMGYRWFQAQGIRPLFPFGHGLSYTSFELDDVRVSEEITDATRSWSRRR